MKNSDWKAVLSGVAAMGRELGVPIGIVFYPGEPAQGCGGECDCGCGHEEEAPAPERPRKAARSRKRAAKK